MAGLRRFTFKFHAGPSQVEEVGARLDATQRFAKRVLRGTEHVHVAMDAMTEDAARLDVEATFKLAGF